MKNYWPNIFKIIFLLKINNQNNNKYNKVITVANNSRTSQVLIKFVAEWINSTMYALAIKLKPNKRIDIAMIPTVLFWKSDLEGYILAEIEPAMKNQRKNLEGESTRYCHNLSINTFKKLTILPTKLVTPLTASK